MALRNGVPIEIMWVHVNMLHSRAQTLIDRCRQRQAERLPGVQLSVCVNLAGSQALVKVSGRGDEFLSSIPGNVRPAILRIFTEADHLEALAMAQSPEWSGVQ